MPELNGLEATKKILLAFRKPPFSCSACIPKITLVRQALDAGARGYVLKNANDLDLAKAIKSVAAGKSVLDPQLHRAQALKGERESALTTRELEVLQHIVAGKSNKEIATELELSVNTVSVHRANIMDRLGIHKPPSWWSTPFVMAW